MNTKPGLYVHVPFCLKKCHYCDYVITTKRDPSSLAAYFEALEREIREAIRRYGPLTFDTLYLGGGTPSALDGHWMRKLVELLRREFHFNSEGEWTCEVNPGDVDAGKLAVYRELGINRISLGAQTFNDSLLKDMGRLHTAQQTVETVRQARQCGFENISLDLMIAIPAQTLEDVREAVRQTIALNAAQAAVFDLDVADPTVYGFRRRRGQLNFPAEELHQAMMTLIEEDLTRSGYRHYELTNFARTGFESRHNLIYWNNREYLGLGPGAFSYMEGVRYQFSADVNRYLAKCGREDWTRDIEDRLSPEEKEFETLLTGLRLAEGIDLDHFEIIRRRVEEKAKALTDSGLVERRGSRLALTRPGRFLSDRIFSELLEPAA